MQNEISSNEDFKAYFLKEKKIKEKKGQENARRKPLVEFIFWFKIKTDSNARTKSNSKDGVKKKKNYHWEFFTFDLLKKIRSLILQKKKKKGT